MELNFVKYEKVHTEFKQFFKSEELRNQLNKKADISLLHNLNNQKVSLQDLEQITTKIRSLTLQMRHLSIIQIEMTNSMIPFKLQNSHFMDELDNKKMVRNMKCLHKNAKIISNWIDKKEKEDELLIQTSKQDFIDQSTNIYLDHQIKELHMSGPTDLRNTQTTLGLRNGSVQHYKTRTNPLLNSRPSTQVQNSTKRVKVLRPVNDAHSISNSPLSMSHQFGKFDLNSPLSQPDMGMPFMELRDSNKEFLKPQNQPKALI